MGIQKEGEIMECRFPKDFLWGAGTSSHQIEGGLKNNWTEWEEKNMEHLIKRTSKDIDAVLFKKAQDPECYLSNGRYSCESSKYWKEDIKAMRELKLNAYRFSLEWSRIEPKKGIFDEAGIDFYINFIRELKESGIEPVVTIWHWTLPVWLSEEGGIMSKDFLKYWERFVRYVVKKFGKEVKFWITINEPSVVVNMSYLLGEWPPAEKNIFLWSKYYFFTFPKSHKIAYRVIKEENPQSMVSFAHQGPNFDPLRDNAIDRLVASISNYLVNFVMINSVIKYLDYIALNFYFNNLVGFGGFTNGLFVQRNRNDVCTDMRWWYQPKALGSMVRKLFRRYDLPVMITENGLADYKDSMRREWLDESIGVLGECLSDGVNVIGYMHWSLLDNFELADGFWPQFGLVAVDPISKERKIKKSGYHYMDLIEKYS